MTLIKFKRGTRAKIESAAASGRLHQAEPYIVTDESRIAIGTSNTSYEDVAMLSDISSAALGVDDTPVNGEINRAISSNWAFDHTAAINPHNITKTDIGLSNVDNTSDSDKPVSDATQVALNAKANFAELGSAAFTDSGVYATASQGDLADTAIQPGHPALTDAREWVAGTVGQTEAEAGTATTRRAWTAQRVFQAIASWWSSSAAKMKLDGIATGATANATDAHLLARANHTGTQAHTTITGLGTAATRNVGTVTGTVAAGDDTRLSDARTPTAHTHTLSNISDSGSLAALSTNGLTTEYLRGDGGWATPPNTEYSAGAGILLSGTQFSHADTSAQASVDNSDGNVVQDITLDGYGHITAVGTYNLDGRYYTKSEADARFTDTYAASYTVKSASEVGYTKEAVSGRFAHLRGGISIIGAVTFQAALADAASKGVRLPTVEELESEIARGTGGGYDSYQCWTCTAVPGMPGYVYTKLGTGAGSRNPTPTDGSATAYTRYVANVNVPVTDVTHSNGFSTEQKTSTRTDFGFTGTGGANVELYSKTDATRGGRLGFIYGGGDFGDVLFTHFNGSTWNQRASIDKDGNIIATAFYGDGSNLTGIVGTGLISDAPTNGTRYARKDGDWVSIDPYVVTPTITSPTNGATNVGETPTITTSEFALGNV